MEHPAERNEMDSQWSSTVLKESACDAFLDITSFDLAGIGGKYDVVYATGYNLQKLALFYSTNSRWTDPDKVRRDNRSFEGGTQKNGIGNIRFFIGMLS